jgi:hypothetical protein
MAALTIEQDGALRRRERQSSEESTTMIKPLPPPFNAIRARVPTQEFKVIFNACTNEAQSCLQFATAFPDTMIFAFEGVPQTFDALKNEAPAHQTTELDSIAVEQINGFPPHASISKCVWKIRGCERPKSWRQ